MEREGTEGVGFIGEGDVGRGREVMCTRAFLKGQRPKQRKKDQCRVLFILG